MTQQVDDVAIDVWDAADPTGTADHTIPQSDIERVQTTNAVGASRGGGFIRVHDPNATHRDNLDLNYRVDFKAQLRDESSLNHRFSGRAVEVTPLIDRDLEQYLELDLEAFVPSLLGDRTTANAFDDVQVAGTSSSIVNSIVADEAPAINLSNLNSITDKRTVEFDYTNLLEAVRQSLDLAGAVMGFDQTDLLATDREAFTTDFFLEPADIRLPVELPIKGDGYANRIIVRGARGLRTTETQTTQTDTVTVTDSAFITQQITPAYDSIPEVEVYTSTTGSGEAISVYVQPGNGSGAPVDATDRQADVGSATVQAGDLTNGGFTRFRVGVDSVSSPAYLIVESSGSAGQDIGYNDADSSGTFDSSEDIAYKLFRSYPSTSEAPDQTEIINRGRVDKRVIADDIQTIEQARNLAQSLLAQSATPPRPGEWEADRPRAHDFSLLDCLKLTKLPYVDATSDKHVVTRVEHEFEANQLQTTFQTKRLGSI